MRLNEIYEANKDNIEFFLIYVREAHPSDGWQTLQNLETEIFYKAPTTADERAEVGNACQIGLALKYPMLIDNIDFKTNFDRSEGFAKQFLPVAVEFALLGMGFASAEEALEYLQTE